MLLLIIFLNIFFFLSNVTALSITIQPDTIAGQPSLVVWTRDPSDGGDQLAFDLRFLRLADHKDVGLAIANIQASPSTQYGTAQVVFPSPGSYELVAVSGLDDTNLSASSQVNVYTIPTTTSAAPTSTSTSKPTPSATTTPVPHMSTASGVHHKKNLGAIIGGTLGGVAFLGLLAGLLLLFLRRRRPEDDNKRWTFHRDMMIRPASANANAIMVIAPSILQPSFPLPPDVEQGLPHDTDESEVVMIASPNGPRPLIKPFLRPLPLPPGSLTDRQDAITKQMELLKNEMMELERNAGPTQHIMLDDMQKQVTWLQDQMRSPWAMGLTDVTPLGFAHMEYRV